MWVGVPNEKLLVFCHGLVGAYLSIGLGPGFVVEFSVAR